MREWAIPSASRPGVTHRVGLAWEGGHFYCTCEAGRFGRECSHVRAVMARMREEDGMSADTAMTMIRPGERLPDLDIGALEHLLANNDLAKMDGPQRIAYYKAACDSLGLNYLTLPFRFITFPQGGTQLYPQRNATEQLRRNGRVSIYRLDHGPDGDFYTATAFARTPDGREDVDVGAVSIKGLSGEAYANAVKKAITQAKRRVTLSIVGLGWLDESEVGGVAGAATAGVNLATGEIIDVSAMAPAASAAEVSGKPAETPQQRYARVVKAAIADGSMTADDFTGLIRDVFGKAHSRDLTADEREIVIDVAERRRSFGFTDEGKYLLVADEPAGTSAETPMAGTIEIISNQAG